MLPYLAEYFAFPSEIERMGFSKRIVDKYSELCEKASRIVVTSISPVEEFEELLNTQSRRENQDNLSGWLEFDLLMGFFELKRGSFSSALSRYSRIIAQSNNVRVGNGLALLFLNIWKKSSREEYRKKAADLLEIIVKKSKNHYSSRVNLAAIYYSKRELDRAEKLLEEAIKINSEIGVAYFNLAILRKNQKNTEINKTLRLLDISISCKYPYELAPLLRNWLDSNVRANDRGIDFASAA